MSRVCQPLDRTFAPTNIDYLTFQPYEYLVEYCYLKALSSAALPLTGPKCQDLYKTVRFFLTSQVTVDGVRGDHVANLSHLQPFTEYNVTIRGTINPFKRSRLTNFYSRTRKSK